MGRPVPLPGIDPSQVNTPAELAACLDGLRRRRGLSYDAIEKAAGRLRRPVEPTLEPLAKSTIGEIVTGKRLPTRGKLNTFLAVCQVSSADRPQWLAAWERASTADLAKPAGAVRVRAARPRELGVQAAIQIEGAPGELPLYVPRDIDAGLRTALAAGAGQGCFLLLVGGSSVGKTRTLYEAVLAVLPDWWLVYPADSDEIRRLAHSPTPRTVLWLDELQRYLGGTHGLTAATVRALLQTGIVLVGTLWPDDYAIRIVPRHPDSADLYAADRQLLNLAQIHGVADTFSTAERKRAAALARSDRRLRTGLEAPDAGLTQVLAAGPALVRWWEQSPTPYGKAVITAAVDARRLGVQAPITAEFLTDAAPGYLTSTQQAKVLNNWLEVALTYATTELHGAASALAPVAVGMGVAAGYTVADYLVQHARRVRRTARLPAEAWQALVEHIHHVDDIDRLIANARWRMRFRYLEPLHRKQAGTGDQLRVRRLATLLATQGRVEEAMAVLQPLVDKGDPFAVNDLAELLKVQGQADEAIEILRTPPAVGHWSTAIQLVELLVEQGRADEAIDALRTRGDGGDQMATQRLVNLLVERGYNDRAIEFLRTRVGDPEAAMRLAGFLIDQGITEEAKTILRLHADDGYEPAARRLGELLVEGGREDEAIEVLRVHSDSILIVERLVKLLVRRRRRAEAIEILRPFADVGWQNEAMCLADLLIREGRIDELQARADAGDHAARSRLAKVLAREGHIDELQARADAGDYIARDELAELFVEQGRSAEAIEDLRRRVDHGDASAALRLANLLTAEGRADEAIDVLQTPTAVAFWITRGKLVDLLAERHRYQEAIEVLRAWGDGGDGSAEKRVTELLVEQGRVDEAIEVLRVCVEAGNESAGRPLVDLLARRGHIEALKAEVDAGNPDAESRLIEAVSDQGGIARINAERMRKFGLNADGSIAGPDH
jgi:predicted negative regulator of RcsB-dependent stress response